MSLNFHEFININLILAFRRNIQETYDLKGSVRNRLANEGEKTDDSSQMQAKFENLKKLLSIYVLSHLYPIIIGSDGRKSFENS